jgi:type I restriction enzyme, S subunit
METTTQKIDLKKLVKSRWETFHFEEFASKISETVDPNTTTLETYVGLEHLDADDIHIRRKGTPDDVSGGKLKCYPGDVIFGKRRAYQRKAAIVDFEGICSAHAFVFRANPEVIDPKLFPFFLHSNQFMHRMVDISVGGLSPTINWGDLKHQEFLLPLKDQQAQLAELLWAMDEVIEREREVLERLNVFNEVFSQNLLGLIGTKKNGWIKKSLKEVAPLQRGFDLPSTQLIEGNYPVGYSNGIKYSHSEYKVVGPGVWTGRSGTIGNVFYTEDNYWPHNTSLWVTDFNNNHPKYIYHLYSKLHFEKRMTGTGVPTLNRNDIHKFKIYVPEISEQKIISNKIDMVDKLVIKAQAKTSSSQALQKSLINQIF